jgi:hypothetical protein
MSSSVFNNNDIAVASFSLYFSFAAPVPISYSLVIFSV